MRYVRTYESFRGGTVNEGKIADIARSMLSKGVLPVVIVATLARMCGQDKAIETVADTIENTRSAGAFAREIAQARKNAKEKCRKFDNYEWLAKQIDGIQVVIGDIPVGAIAQYISDNEEKMKPVIVINSKEGLEELVREIKPESDRMASDSDHVVLSRTAKGYVVGVLTHEFMHFVDDLLKRGTYWSKDNSDLLLSLLDKHPTKEKVADRFSRFRWGESIDVVREADEGLASGIEEEAERIMSTLDYIRKPSEIFVRVQGLRRILFEIGIIESVNSEIEEQDLMDFMVYMTRNDNVAARERAITDEDVFVLLSIIDWDSLVKNINRVAKADGDVPQDVA